MRRWSLIWIALLVQGALAVAAREVWSQPTPPAPAAPAAPAAGAVQGQPATAGRLAPTLRFQQVAKPPKGNINDFAQDEQGFLWVGANEGLGRFDGYQFRYFTPDGKPGSLSEETVTALHADGKGSLWVGTTEGLERLDLATMKFERFQHDEANGNSLAGDVVTDIIGAKDGTIWIGTDAGVSAFTPSTKTFQAVVGESQDSGVTPKVLSLLEDSTGVMWVGTDLGLAKFDRGTAKFARVSQSDEAPASGVVIALYEDAKGRLWVGTNDGLYLFDRKTTTFTRQWADQLRTITTLRAGVGDAQLIIGTREDGVFFGDLDRELLVNHRANPNRSDAILNPYVNATFVDRGGVLWVGFYSSGVVKTDLAIQGITYYATKPGLAFLENPDGTVWIGHEGSLEGSGLRLFDPKSGRSQMFLEKERAGTWITTIVRDDEGWLWMGTSEQGVYRFNPTTNTYVHFTADDDEDENRRVSAPGVFAVYFDKDTRKVWLGTHGGGLDIYDLANDTFQRIQSADHPNMLSSNSVFAFHQDRQDPDIMWMGTGGGGLVRLQKSTGTFTVFRAPKADEPPAADKLSNDFVTSIHESADGTLWLGTYGGGLNRFDRKAKSFRAFRTTDGLPTDVVYGVMGDKAGALWLLTNNGLVKFDPASSSSFTFTEADGIGQDEFSQGAYYAAPSGLLFVGGHRGFNIVDPTKLKPSTYVGPIRLTGLRVFDEERPLRDHMKFAYTDGVIRIDFASLSYAAPGRTVYRYRLPPLYNKWLEADGSSITLTNLPGDSYQLEVQATNHHGVTSQEKLSFSFGVDPPPWRTWWAYIGYCIVIILVALAVLRFQRRRFAALQAKSRLDAVERDLALTGAVQTSFLPEQPEVASQWLQLIGLYRPADACGGDWWWHERLSGGRQVIMVGDVTGHGPGPAMVTAAVATAFRVLLEAGADDVKDVLEALNREVLRVGKGRYHMTMAALEVDEAAGTWIFHSAGGPPILSLNPKGKHRVVFCPGAPLGTEHDFEIGRVQGKFKSSERMLLYTDGIPEIEMPSGSTLGMRRFAQLYESTRNQHLRDAANTLMFQADRTLAGQAQADDWTFTMIEWNDPRAGTETMSGTGTSTTSLTFTE